MKTTDYDTLVALLPAMAAHLSTIRTIREGIQHWAAQLEAPDTLQDALDSVGGGIEAGEHALYNSIDEIQTALREWGYKGEVLPQ